MSSEELSKEPSPETETDASNSDIEVIEVQEPDQTENAPIASPGEGIKSLKCPICLETPDIVAVAACGHPYCHECIFTALSSAKRANRREGECSLCRKRVRYDQTIYMELKKGPGPETSPKRQKVLNED